MIENLPLLTPDATRSAHTIARCHDRLAARRRKIEARNRRTAPAHRARRGAPAAGGLRARPISSRWPATCCRSPPGADRSRVLASAARRRDPMVSVLSLLIPIALSAVFVFIASSIIHMATPWHKGDLKKVPERRGVMNALRPFNLPPGDYGMPKPGSMKDMGSPEFLAKFKAGPVAFMTVRPSGEMSMTGTLDPVVPLFAGRVAVRRLHRRRGVRPRHRIPAHHAGRRLRRVHRLRARRRRRSRFGGAAAGPRRSATCSTACSTAC